MRRTVLALAVLLAATAVPAQSAQAQPAPPPSGAAGPAGAGEALVPPRPVTPLTAAYPEGAQGDAKVVLVLTINTDGSVRSAQVEQGPEPFASAALSASSKFRFDPATRNGTPIVARIRAEILFSREGAAPPTRPSGGATPERGERGEPSGQTTGAPPSAGGVSSPNPPLSGVAPPEGRVGGAAPSTAPAVPAEAIEVTVRGEQAPPGTTTLTRAEVRLLPGAFGDPFRAVEVLPGVVPLASGIPFFYVRGAPPGNVGYFLDGIRVPLLYHIGLGPSVVHPAMVERVDLHPGGYPARYGRFAGGIVAGETQPPLPEWHGEATIRIIDAGAMVEAPFADGRGSALVGGRYAYPGALLTLLGSDVRLHYSDYQARIGYDLTARDRISVFAFGAYDYLGQQEEGRDTITTLFDTTFHRLDLRYEHRFGLESTVRQAVTLGYDQTRLFEGRYARELMIGARSEILYRDGAGLTVRAGTDAWTHQTRTDLDRGVADEDPFSSLFSKRRLDLFAGAFAEATLPVTRRLEITPGLRLDLYESQGEAALAVEPRLSARLALGRGLTFFQAHGLASQAPSFILPGPGFRPPLEGGLQRSLQTSAGLEITLPEETTAKITLFRNAFFDMNDAFGTPPSGGDFTDAFRLRSLGQSVGAELSLHRRLTRKLGGFLAYTLARSTRAYGRNDLPSTFDRTHVANAAAVYDFGRGYKAGGRLLFYTGGPKITQAPDGTQVPLDERLPPFFRFDIRLEKRWTIARGWLSFVIEVQNVTLSEEAIGSSCFEGTCEPVWVGPVTIPSIGVEGGF